MLTTERAVAEVVVRRLGAAWFIGVLLLSFTALYFLATMRGPEMEEQLLKNSDYILTFINIVALLLLTVVSATEIPYDITGRVLLVVLTKPIRRYQYVIGKFFGVAGVGLIYVLLCEAFSLGALHLMGYTPDATFFSLSGSILLRVIVGAGFGVLMSSCFAEVPTIAGCVAFGVLSFGINLFALMLLKAEIPLAVKAALSPLLYAVPCLQTLSAPPTALADYIAGRSRDIQKLEGIGLDNILESFTPSLPLSTLYATFYVLTFLALAIFFFHRTERIE